MTPDRVAQLPLKPLLIYDGDCNFCRLWVRRWQNATGERVDYLPLQSPEIAVRFPELTSAQLEESVHYIAADGGVYRGAAAVFRSLSCVERWPLAAYEHVPGVAAVTEAAYRQVARRRRVFSFLTRALWGSSLEPASFFLARGLFIRLLGVIYLIAFASLGTQILGLIGSHGIVPAGQTMQQLHQQVGEPGLSSFLRAPTLCWWGAEDRMLQLHCTAGVALSVCVILGLAQAPCLLMLWLLYLSLSTIGGVFLGYQWDALLLETGWLAVFFAPVRFWAGVRREPAPSRLFLWLLRWLLFRLMFASGCVKLLSGDATWHQMTALTFHYETQPLPTWVAWHMHQLPLSLHKVSCAVMFAIELGVPFLIGMPRRLRFVAFGCIVLLQGVILVTGNYTFFNYLTIVLCVPLLDDQALLRFCPHGLAERLGEARAWERVRPRTWARLGLWAVRGPVAAVLLVLGCAQVAGMFGITAPWPLAVETLARHAAPFRSVNHYGLFAIMTTERPEIIVEGSRDGKTWLAYEFKDKPGDLRRRPGFVAPHQPRLDWQMWFAALGDVRQNRWFVNFCVRLMQGAPEVIDLMEANPFPDAPPKYVRALLYDYHFTRVSERDKTRAWWRREPRGMYCPPLSLPPVKQP